MNTKQLCLVSALSVLFSSNCFADIDLKVGEEKVEKFCKVCHSKAMSAVMKSPTMHAPDKWLPFIKEAVLEADKLKTTECSKLTAGKKETAALKLTDKEVGALSLKEKACYMLPNAKAGIIKGAAVMPPKGTCAECSDNDLLSAIAFMNKEEK